MLKPHFFGGRFSHGSFNWGTVGFKKLSVPAMLLYPGSHPQRQTFQRGNPVSPSVRHGTFWRSFHHRDDLMTWSESELFQLFSWFHWCNVSSVSFHHGSFSSCCPIPPISDYSGTFWALTLSVPATPQCFQNYYRLEVINCHPYMGLFDMADDTSEHRKIRISSYIITYHVSSRVSVYLILSLSLFFLLHCSESKYLTDPLAGTAL